MNNTLFSNLLSATPEYLESSADKALNQRQPRLMFLAAGFLVSVPVFIQAPLVRLWPWLSLLLTLFWISLGYILLKRSQARIWGDLILGFSWSWLAGSIYWGWFRQDPLIHIPIESIGLPFALWGLGRGWGKVGNLFYLGSLLGTAMTDLYFYLTGLMDSWRQLMTLDPSLITPILQNALAQVQTPWGISWFIVLANLLLGIGLWGIQKQDSHWWGFSGAVFSTILVDSLFFVAISMT